jgi:hypothetical protein
VHDLSRFINWVSTDLRVRAEDAIKRVVGGGGDNGGNSSVMVEKTSGDR